LGYQVANCRNPVRVAALLNDVPQGSRDAPLRGNPGLMVETASRFGVC